MSNTETSNTTSGEINVPDLLSEQSGMPNMSSKKTFVVDTNMQVTGDLGVTGDVIATSFIGDGSQLTGISGGTGGGLDSAAVTLLVDSDYVQARETPQDFAYSSLTGAPTALSSFTNDTSYITAADIPTTVDSDYVAARAPAGGGGGLDSAGVTSLIDSDYVQLKGLFYTGTDKQWFGPDAGFQSTSAFSVAVGRSAGANSVNSTNSIAVGYKAGFASQGESIHIGRETGEVNPGSNLVSIGTEANQYNAGASSVAIGYRAAQNGGGSGSITIGRDARAAGDNSVTVGINGIASSDNSVAVGINAETTADYSVAIGDNATVSNPAVIGIAIGRNTSVTTPGGVGGVAIGSGASVSDNDTLAIGRNTVASAADATAIGPNTTASGLRSIAIGNNVTASTDDAVTIGSSVAGRLTYDTTNDWTFGAGVTMTDLTASGATVVFSNLPTTDPLNAGQLWNDLGTLKISAG